MDKMINLLNKKIIDGVPLIHSLIVILLILAMFSLDYLDVKSSIKSIMGNMLGNILAGFIVFILLENYRISKVKQNFLKQYRVFKLDILEEIISVVNEEEIFNEKLKKELLKPQNFREFLDEDEERLGKLFNALIFDEYFRENFIRKLSLFKEDINRFVGNFEELEEKIIESFWILKNFLSNLERSRPEDWEKSDYLNKITLRFLNSWFSGGDPLIDSKFLKEDSLESLVKKIH
jgi:hypothetical protein